MAACIGECIGHFGHEKRNESDPSANESNPGQQASQRKDITPAAGLSLLQTRLPPDYATLS